MEAGALRGRQCMWNQPEVVNRGAARETNRKYCRESHGGPAPTTRRHILVHRRLRRDDPWLQSTFGNDEARPLRDLSAQGLARQYLPEAVQPLVTLSPAPPNDRLGVVARGRDYPPTLTPNPSHPPTADG